MRKGTYAPPYGLSHMESSELLLFMSQRDILRPNFDISIDLDITVPALRARHLDEFLVRLRQRARIIDRIAKASDRVLMAVS